MNFVTGKFESRCGDDPVPILECTIDIVIIVHAGSKFGPGEPYLAAV